MNNNLFLKWVGGKTQILDILFLKYPKIINNYYDLFLGGGSTLFKILDLINNNEIKLLGKIYAYDINENLINTYLCIKNNPNELFDIINNFINEYISIKVEGKKIKNPININDALTSSENYYYYIRNMYNNLNNDNENNILIKSALFIFLNKTCFRGLYRVGPNGFNVPFGHYKNKNIIDKKLILKISSLIQNVNFKCIDCFEVLKQSFNKNDFLYLDPPYVPIKENSFTKYNLNDFNLDNHKKLFNILKNLNINFLLSNSDNELIYKYFNNNKFNIEIIKCKRAINSKNPGEIVNEVLINNILNNNDNKNNDNKNNDNKDNDNKDNDNKDNDNKDDNKDNNNKDNNDNNKDKNDKKIKRNTKDGKDFENKTDFEKVLLNDNCTKIILNKKSKEGYYLRKEYDNYEILFFKQSSLKKYLQQEYNILIFRNPDEAFIIKNKITNKLTLKILEKKYQKVEGSVETKLYASQLLKEEYEELLNNYFNIEYGFCLNNYFKDKFMDTDNNKYQILKKLLIKYNIPIFYGEDNDYIEKIFNWINNF